MTYYVKNYVSTEPFSYVMLRAHIRSRSARRRFVAKVMRKPGGGGELGIFWAGMCRPGLQIGTPF